jgi:hypothetical protein
MSYLDVEMPECLDLLVPTDGASSPNSRQAARSNVDFDGRSRPGYKKNRVNSDERTGEKNSSTQILVARIDQIKTKLMCLDEHQTRFIICVVLSRLLSSLNWDTFCARYINKHAD